MFCLAALQRRPVLYHSRWLLIVLWPSVHLGQVAPTTLPQCRLVSNPRFAGLSLSLSLAFCSAGFSLSVCVSPSLSLCVPRPLSLCVCVCVPRPLHPPKGFSLSPHPPRGFFFLSPSPRFLSVPLSPESLPRLTPLSACRLISGISSFAWRCAQQRVEEPYSVPRYRVR